MQNLDVAECDSSKAGKLARIKCRGCCCNIATILCTLTRRLRRTTTLFDAEENCRVAFKTDRIIIVAKDKSVTSGEDWLEFLGQPEVGIVAPHEYDKPRPLSPRKDDGTAAALPPNISWSQSLEEVSVSFLNLPADVSAKSFKVLLMQGNVLVVRYVALRMCARVRDVSVCHILRRCDDHELLRCCLWAEVNCTPIWPTSPTSSISRAKLECFHVIAAKLECFHVIAGEQRDWRLRLELGEGRRLYNACFGTQEVPIDV
jgi:hypothetical protein